MRRLIDDRFDFNAGRGAMMGKRVFVAQALALPMVGQAISERTVLVEGAVAWMRALQMQRRAAP